jgi:hypothetical protein
VSKPRDPFVGVKAARRHHILDSRFEIVDWRAAQRRLPVAMSQSPVSCLQSLSPESRIPVCMLQSFSFQCQVTRFIIMNRVMCPQRFRLAAGRHDTESC